MQTRTERQKQRNRDLSRERMRRKRARDKAAKEEAKKLKLEIQALQGRRRVREMPEELIDDGIQWMSDLLVPDGERVGQRFDLSEWQRDWIRAGMMPDIQVSGLSISRKNAKTMKNVLKQACFLAGPWHTYGWNGIVCADVGEHAQTMMEYLRALARVNGLDIIFKGVKAPCYAYGKDHSVLECLAANGSRTGHANNADVVWLDEAGAFVENQRPLWNALYSSISSRNGKVFALGNQREGPMFAELEKRAVADEQVHWKRYVVPMERDPLDEASWIEGNPGLGTIKSWEYMRGKAKDALISPGNLIYFQSFDLNQDVDPTKSSIVMLTQWNECIDETADLRGEPVVVGIDLGGSVSMSAAVAIGLRTGTMQMWAAFSSEPDILQRGRNDGVDNTYVLMEKAGELKLHPGEVVDVGWFVGDVLQDLAERECRIVGLGADRYRRAEFSQALTEAGARAPVAWRAMGAGSEGFHDIRAFQRAVSERELRTRVSLGMVNAILNSHVEHDRNNNPILMKNKSRGRIDLVSAAVIAAGLYELGRENAQREMRPFVVIRSEAV